jgi:hypothetical protein
MAVLPRYRRLGVEAQAPTRIDFSPMREVAGVGLAISQNVDRMGDFIYREQVRRAEMAGQEAVREQGAIPILQRLSEQGGPGISIAEQSAYEAANRVAVSEIQFEAENQISALLQSATDSNTPFSAVNTQLEDIVDGFSASLGYLNPEAAGLLQARLRNSTADASRRYASAYQARARAAAAERRSDVATGFATSALELARVEGSTPETLFSSLQENRQALIDSGMSAEHADRWFNSAYSTAVRDNMLYRGMTAPLTDLRTMVETPPTEPLPGMTYAETLTEYGRVQTIYNSRLTGYESDARALGGRIDTARRVLSDGGVVGPEAMAEILVEAERLEFLTPELRVAAENLRADTAFIGNVRGMNIAELETALAQYTGGMPGVGEPGIDTPVEVYRLDVVTKALNAANRAAAAATAETLKAADPELRLLATAAQVVDSVMGSATPNPLVAEEAMRVLMDSYNALPAEIITEDMRESMAEVQQTMAALESWRESQPAELAAELERLRSAIPSADNLPEGVDLIDQMAINQRQANLLSGFINAQQSALAGGNALAYAQSQDVMIEDPMTGEPRVVGQPINLTGDPASVRASLDQRFREVDYVQDRFGAGGQSVLLPQERAMIEGILTAGQPGQRAVILGMIADQGADRAERIFRSLDVSNPEMRLYSHIGSLMTSGNERAAALALRGMEVEQPPALTDMEVSRSFRSHVGEAFAYMPNTAEAMRQTARFIYAEAASRDTDLAEMILGDAWDSAMSLAMGDLSVKTINNNKVVIESGVSVGLVEEWLSQLTPMPEIIQNADQLGDYSFDALQNDTWHPVAVGQDMYELHTGEGVNSSPWTDREGRPVLISLYRINPIIMYPGGAGQ